MPSPFPGMDPYLEHPTLWPGVHNGLIAALQLLLAPQLRPRYYVAIEERLYITEPDQRVFVGRPDLVIVRHPEPLDSGLRCSRLSCSVQVHPSIRSACTVVLYRRPLRRRHIGDT